VAGPAGGRVTTEVPASAWPRVHEVIARLTHDGHTEQSGGSPDIAGLVERLREAGLLCSSNDVPALTGDLTFAGHNTVVVRSARSSVVVDPFLFPSSASYPDTYQPLGAGRLGTVDALLITHSHPDHFDPATLIRFPPDIRVIVPVAERETVLGADMRHRLGELGFTNVVVLGWGEAETVGDIVVHALPFYGEQPSDGRVLHPDVRNVGNTYVVETPAFSAAFLADSGRDHAGDVRDVPERWRREHPPVDVVFAGYRGWSTYPVQHVFSSVAAFMLFVPPTLWGCRHQLMTDAADAVDVAERFGARYLVPYADGGAPWHWEIGLGPKLDGSGTEDPDFDPYPERVIDVARRRIRAPGGEMVASPVRVLLLRPGDSVTDVAGEAGVVRVPGHSWAYPDTVRLG
jgi:L-ascorbate metabolism protein UlaG (beta-lactamase superfamily)